MRRIHVFLFIAAMFVVLLGLIGKESTTASNVNKAANAHSMLSALPASDAIAFVDTQRLLNETMPTVFANRPDLLAKVRVHIDKAKTEIGIDPNLIDAAALGISFKSKSNAENAVVIVRGRFDAKTAIDAGFTNIEKEGKMKRQQTTYEGRTIHYLKRIQTNTKSNSNPISFDNDTAVVILDPQTVAVSDVNGIRTAIDAANGKNRVSDELVALATRNTSALVSFSGNTKALNDFQLFDKGGQFLEGINQFYGSLWASSTEFEGQVTLRTDTSERANDLRDSLNGLKILASGFIGGKDSAALRDLLKGISVEAVGNEVDLRGKASVNSISLIIDKF